jgi:hypothetical protein
VISSPLMPAEAGIQYFAKNWVPAFRGDVRSSYFAVVPPSIGITAPVM